LNTATLPSSQEKDVGGFWETKSFFTREEELSLLEDAKQGDISARNKLVEMHLPLAVNIARKYQNGRLSLQDLVQEGSLGLIRAVEEFDFAKGRKFSTYATWWVRQSIIKALQEQARIIRLPIHTIEAVMEFAKTAERMKEELGYSPGMEDIALEMGISVERAAKISESIHEIASLEAPVFDSEEPDLLLRDFIEDYSPGPEDEAISRQMKDDVHETLSCLNLQERSVVELRFGFVEDEPLSLSEIGRRFNLSRERIRSIESKALQKLRNPKRTKVLAAYRV
jgi:RNA polymerase primary sigma factor